MNVLTHDTRSKGPTDKLCPSEEPNEAMADRGPLRPYGRGKDGSHANVENTDADESRCNEIALERNLWTEPLVDVPQLLERSHEHEASTRDRPAGTGADARIEASVASGEVRLALRPYGRNFKRALRGREVRIMSNESVGG